MSKMNGAVGLLAAIASILVVKWLKQSGMCVMCVYEPLEK